MVSNGAFHDDPLPFTTELPSREEAFLQAGRQNTNTDTRQQKHSMGFRQFGPEGAPAADRQAMSPSRRYKTKAETLIPGSVK